MQYNMVENASKQTGTDYVLHLDHARDLSIISRCIEKKFSSIMYDGSTLPLTENINNTREVLKISRDHGVTVEGEVGIIGGVEDEEEIGQLSFPAVEEVLKYVDSTNVDLVAVAIGTRHGFYKDNNPKLNLDLISEIAPQINIPLVLHGGTGLDKELLMECIRRGIQKINISTDIKRVYADSFLQASKKYDKNYLKIEKFCISSIKEYILNYFSKMEEAKCIF